MAKIASLTAASFGSTKFTEVASVAYEVSGMTSARSKGTVYSPQPGTVTLEVFDAVSDSLWGKRDGLTLSGEGISLTYTALCTSVSLSAQVNDAVRSSVTFQILK